MSQTLHIGGFRFRFEGCPEGALPEPFRDFAAAPSAADRIFAVGPHHPSSAPGRPLVDVRIWKLFERASRLELDFFRLDQPRPLIQAVLEKDWSTGSIGLHPTLVPAHTFAAPAAGPLGELLLMGALAQGAGLYVHASAAAWSDGEVDVFLGASGAGKSTISGLAAGRGAAVLSDDRTVLRFVGGELRAYGTPFHGTGRRWAAREGRVRGLFFLRHAAQTRVEPLPMSAACARLASLCFTHFWDRGAVEETLRLCEQVARAVPTFALAFRPDPWAVDAAAEAATRAGHP